MGVIVAGLVVVGVAAGINHLRRARGRVMDYHHIETPRVNPMRHGGGGTGG